MWTGDKDVNIKVIFVVISTTWVVVKIRPEKNSFNVDIVIYFDTMKSKLFVNFSRALQKYLKDMKYNSLHLTRKREIRESQWGDGLYGLWFKTLANSRLSVNI